MQLRFDYIRQLITVWLAHGGNRKIELAALEPLLWRDGNHQLADLVAYLKECGCTVSLTTNGSLLARHALPLKQAGVDLVRLSWHTMNPDTFAQITGQNLYHRFIDGLESAIANRLPLAINRVLLKGHCADLPEQIAFIDRHQLRLKLLDLYWIPSMAEQYERFYISPHEALNQFADISMLNAPGRSASQHGGRDRIRYQTRHGGIVEYKLGDEARRDAQQCRHCPQQADCLEGFADYLRVFPDESISLCYMRKELGHSMPSSELATLPTWLAQHQQELQMPLRLVLTGQCNFNCGFPGSTRSWCLKQGRGFSFPPRQPAAINEERIYVQNA